MKIRLFYTLCFFLRYLILHAQSPLIKQWDYRYGGTNDELLWDLQQTPDGGFILNGSSRSGISGNITQPNWGISYCLEGSHNQMYLEMLQSRNSQVHSTPISGFCLLIP